MPTKLYVGNVPRSISATELKELFEKYGKVLECDIVKDYAFVHMEDGSKAKASIAALNDFNLKGNRIRVEVSTTQLRNTERSSRREESPRRESSSTSMRSSRHRDHPISSSSRNGGGPDRSYPSVRSSYMDSRSRPYDSPYDRHRMPPPMGYPDSYSMRSNGDPYARDDYYHHHRGPPVPMDHYGRGPPMRRYADSPPRSSSSRNGSSRYGSPPRSSSSRRSKRSPPPSSSSSSRSRR